MFFLWNLFFYIKFTLYVSFNFFRIPKTFSVISSFGINRQQFLLLKCFCFIFRQLGTEKIEKTVKVVQDSLKEYIERKFDYVLKKNSRFTRYCLIFFLWNIYYLICLQLLVYNKSTELFLLDHTVEFKCGVSTTFDHLR